MINLKQLELRNFLSHVDTNLNFEDYEGLVLIEGINSDGHYSSNGSGKSTILEGIVYALTGNTLRNVGVNEVVNRNYKKNTRVTLRFTKDDHLYEISRYRKDKEHGDDILFLKDGENISKRVNKETQQLIEDTLGVSFKVLSSTVLLGEGLSSRFTQLSDPEKKSLIESTLNLSYDMNALRAKSNEQLSKLKLEKSNLEGRISALEGFVDYDVDKAHEDLTRLEGERIHKSQLAESKNDIVVSANAKINQLVDKSNLLRSSITQIDSLTRNLEMLDSQNSQLVSELTNTEKCDNPRCTMCHQELKDDESRNHLRVEYRKRIDAVTSQMMTYRSQLDALPPRDVIAKKYDELGVEIVSMRNEVAALTEESRQTQGEVYQLQSQINSIESNIKGYQDAKADIENLKSDLGEKSSSAEIYDYFYKLFSPTGIIVNILSDAVEYINDRLAVYSSVLLDKQYHINFVKGKISLVDDTGSSYQSLSNGEKRRLDISIQFALHDYVTIYCGMRLNCCYIDEVLDTLDDIGVDNIFDVLRLKLEYCNLSSIYVITHNDSLKSKFDHIITVSKNKNGDSTLL